jgi:hypothetical protein
MNRVGSQRHSTQKKNILGALIMVFTCIYCEVIQYVAPNVNKNYSLCLQEATHTAAITDD